MMPNLDLSKVNAYLSYKQCLLPSARSHDSLEAARRIVALHATIAASPYLSLWARLAEFQREQLDAALYEDRTLVKKLCMRTSMFVVPSDELPFFYQAYKGRLDRNRARDVEKLLVDTGLCESDRAAGMRAALQDRVLGVLAERGPSTVQEISQFVPELTTKFYYKVGNVEGSLSLGSRLIPAMCALGLLVRTRRRGSWRSSLYEYAALSLWLPGVDLEAVSPERAQAWLVGRYLAAFGPASQDDIQWWTGFTKTAVIKALRALEPELVKVALSDLDGDYYILENDLETLSAFSSPETPSAAFLPGLDPYIMGYKDRRRFMDMDQHAKVFDRAGNAVPTLWLNGRLVGVWGQRKDGTVVYATFDPLDDIAQGLLSGQARRLQDFLAGDVAPQPYRTPFLRSFTG